LPLPPSAAKELAPTVALLVDEIVNATGDEKSRRWWAQCAGTLGQDAVYHALGQLRETCQIRSVKNRGAMLTKIFHDIAGERKVTIH